MLVHERVAHFSEYVNKHVRKLAAKGKASEAAALFKRKEQMNAAIFLEMEKLRIAMHCDTGRDKGKYEWKAWSQWVSERDYDDPKQNTPQSAGWEIVKGALRRPKAAIRKKSHVK